MDAVHEQSLQVKRNRKQGIFIQARTMLLKASDVKTCLVSNEHAHITLKRVYDQ